MTVNNQNIIDAVEILKSKRVIDKDIEIAEKLGYTRSVVSSYLNNKIKASRNFTDKFFEHFGSYLENNVVEEDRGLYGSQKKIKEINVPLYEIYSSAGVDIFINTSQLTPITFINSPNFKDCDFALYNKGKSMEEVLWNNDILGVKIISDWSVLQWGEIYVLATDEQTMTKYLNRQSDSFDNLILKSANKDYQDIHIHKSKIKHFALVKASQRGY